MKLTTKSRYGMRLILDLAFNAGNGPVPLNELAARQKISLKYLEKLVRTLKAAGLIKSHRGARGGYELGRDPKHISAGDIVRLLEEQSAITPCAETPAYACDFCKNTGDCLARLIWIEASRGMFAYLDGITLDALINQKNNTVEERKKSNKGLPLQRHR